MPPDISILDPKQSRGAPLADTIFLTFHEACDHADFEVAERLLRVLELMARRSPHKRDHCRREDLILAYKRLWQIGEPTLEVAGKSVTLS
jgi:hypothetical protein